MSTSTAPPKAGAHQKIGSLAPALTAARVAHGVGDLVLFDTDGVVIAFAGGDDDPVDARVQERAESLAAIGQRLLSLSRGADLIKRGKLLTQAADTTGQVADLITLKYKISDDGGEWPVAVCSIAGTLGMISNIAPSESTDSTAKTRLVYVLAALADELGGRPELRSLVARA